MAIPTPHLLTPAHPRAVLRPLPDPTRAAAARVGTLGRWLAPPLTAFVFLVHPLISLLRPARQLQDPGTGWHLATGRLILDTHAIPTQDVFSWTAAGHPWLNYYWLFDSTAALLERLGGLPLYATVCMLIYAAVPVLLYRRMVRMGANILAALLLTAIAHLVLLSHALARPHVVTYLLFAFFLARLDDVHAGRRPAASLWVLPPLATLWCNLHGGFLAGVALAGIFAAVAVVRALWTGAAEDRRAALVFAAAGVAVLLATVVNPNGFELHRDQIHHLKMTTTGVFDEFRSPNFQAATWPVFCFEVLVLGTVVMAFFAGSRLAWVEVALLLFFLHQALHSVRHINLFAIVAAPILARELTVPLSQLLPGLTARWRAIAAEQAGLRSPWLYFPVIAAAFVVVALAGKSGFPTTLDDLQLSRGAAAYIADHRDRFTRPFNTDNVGGSLIYRFGPDLRVFIDDRIYVYGDAFVADEYLPVFWGRREWRDVLARHDVDSAIVSAVSAVPTLLRESPEWELVYEDEQTVLFLRAKRDGA